MSWQEATVVVAAIAGFVGFVRVVLPYVVARSEAERKLHALETVNKRLDLVESKLAERRLPVALGRKVA